MIPKPVEKPPLRWAGGKSWLTDFISTILPLDIKAYHEPFLGGASCFIKLSKITKAYLSDNNPNLINFYNQVRDNFDELIPTIKTFENSKESYYKIRSEHFRSNVEQAAKFFFINRLCFNGLYRVNSKGEFNVPYGSNSSRDILSNLIDLEFLNRKLQLATITCNDFEESLKFVEEKDIVFLDPPYTVAHNKNGFIEYNEKIFTWADQERLARYISAIIEKKAYFILTNAHHKSTIRLYSHLGRTLQADRASTIGASKTSRKVISELLVTNCI